jgi:hypothetical protein
LVAQLHAIVEEHEACDLVHAKEAGQVEMPDN